LTASIPASLSSLFQVHHFLFFSNVKLVTTSAHLTA